ncbi:MAG: peptide ABC transporter substrate-binding protein, partial [Chloroflexota bacterium]|nr:peptide ABC transporter substrate-binding protein [Chloroflexota bacterium]
MIPYDDEQLRILEKRLRGAGVSRRDFLRIAAAATAATAAAGGVARFASSATAAPAGSSPRVAVAGQSGEEQIFYHFSLQDDPLSFDWNLNLYCNAEPETFAGLLQFNADLEAIPDWAESFEPNEDASVWTFHIRPDNTGWSNGDPVTAEDFVWSWERQLNPDNGAAYAGFLFDIKYAEAYNLAAPVEKEGDPLNGKVPTGADLGAVAIDQWTLEVTMDDTKGSGSRGYFPQVVAYTAAVPAHRPSVEEHGSDRWALGDVPLVSNGPFKLDRWEHDVVVELSKNEGYWDFENIALTKVIDPIIPAANAVLAFEAGEGEQQLDWTPVGANDLPRFQEDPEKAELLQKYVYPGIWMLVPSNGIPPFDQIEVRRALSHAVDRSRLVSLTNELAIEAQGMVPVGVFGFIDDPAIAEIQAFDPQLAIDALAGTEFEGGENWPEITMHVRGQEEIYNSNLMANDIVAQLKEHLNMDVTINVIPEASWRPELFKNEHQLVWIRWWYDYPDPNNGYGDM